MAAIEVVGLTKQYRGRRGPVKALDGLDLEVPEGGVFGFLGANGAGKTTTIRAAVGHLRANKGTIRMLGAMVPDQLPSVIDRVGALAGIAVSIAPDRADDGHMLVRFQEA